MRTVPHWCRALSVALAFGAGSTGCINTFKSVQPRRIEPHSLAGDTTRVQWLTPVRAHLKDGSTVVYPGGAGVNAAAIIGAGMTYPFLSDVGSIRHAPIPLDSLVAVETYDERTDVGTSVVVSVGATALGGLATIGLLVAIFGSCPTVYADTGAGPMLEAEGFSYAIAPLFEHRDLDPLTVRPGPDGILRLELRNEALETHRINHIELLAVAHPAGTLVLPDQQGRLAVVGDLRPLVRAVDRAGRDVTPLLRGRDGELFATASTTLAAARPGDLEDWIDLDVGDLPATDSFAVVLRLRNSLLNTVLLYDGMLSARDAPDLLGTDLHRIATAVEFGDWYRRSMGMRIEMGELTTRIADVGPIAFREEVIVLPRPARSLPIRLRFAADNWRIDQVRVAASVARPEARPVALTQVVVPTPADGGAPRADPAAREALRWADDHYLETLPGQRMLLEFDPGGSPASAGETAYVIAWQGWYREWVRPEWLAHPRRVTPFAPGEGALFAAVARWRETKAEFEARFYASPVGVR